MPVLPVQMLETCANVKTVCRKSGNKLPTIVQKVYIRLGKKYMNS